MFMHGHADIFFHGRLAVLFYTTLFIASLILLSVLLWLFNLMFVLYQSMSRSRIQNTKQNPADHLSEKEYGKNSKRKSRVWGRKPHSTPANLARTHPAKPDELTPGRWSGNDYEVSEYHSQASVAGGATLSSYLARKNLEDKTDGNGKQNAGHKLRDDGSMLSGRAYKPSQDAVSTFAIDKKAD